MVTRAELITTDEGLREAKELDDRAFGEHRGIGLETLKSIAEHGAVFGLRDGEGRLVGEAQLITGSVAGADERLVRALGDTCGYLEGFAVDPEHSGKGYGRELVRRAEAEAIRRGVRTILATVRVENGSSIGVLTKEGYEIVGYDPDYYVGENGARLIVRKDLGAEQKPEKEVEIREAIVTSEGDLKQAGKRVLIPASEGNTQDLGAHHLIRQALSKGYVGTGIARAGRWSDDATEARNAIRFTRRTT